MDAAYKLADQMPHHVSDMARPKLAKWHGMARHGMVRKPWLGSGGVSVLALVKPRGGET
jgi:hypothetical protein